MSSTVRAFVGGLLAATPVLVFVFILGVKHSDGGCPVRFDLCDEHLENCITSARFLTAPDCEAFRKADQPTVGRCVR